MTERKAGNFLSIILKKIYSIDTILGLGFFSYLLIKWMIMMLSYSHVLFVISLVLLIGLFLLSFLIDWLLNYKKKAFYIQIIFNTLLLILYSAILIIFIIILPGVLNIGLFLFSILIAVKVFRIISLVTYFKNASTESINTKITILYFKRYRKASVIFLTLFLFPLIIFVFGITPVSVVIIEVDINNQQGQNKGSNEIQLSFYATSSSYDYLTDPEVLGALNGTDFGDGALEPVEILLLVSDSELMDVNDSLELAHIVRNCTDSDLKVWIWFVYNEVDGHYPSHMNYDYMNDFKDLFDEWVDNHSLDIHGILFDNEMDEQEVTDENLLGSLDVMVKHREEVQKDWDDAVEAYEDAAEDWDDEGYKIALVGMDITLIDVVDGDPDVQQLFGIVNKPPDMWERVSFMFYRGCEYHTYSWGQDYLYNMAEYHKEVYGDRAVVAIGCMAYAAYETVDDIVKDIALLKYLNYETVELFEFRAFYAEFGQNGLEEVLESSLEGWEHDKFYIQFTTFEYFSRVLLFLADILLDLY